MADLTPEDVAVIKEMTAAYKDLNQQQSINTEESKRATLERAAWLDMSHNLITATHSVANILREATTRSTSFRIEQEKIQRYLNNTNAALRGQAVNLKDLRTELKLTRNDVLALGDSLKKLQSAGIGMKEITDAYKALRNVRGASGANAAIADWTSARARGLGANSSFGRMSYAERSTFNDIQRGGKGPIGDAQQKDIIAQEVKAMGDNFEEKVENALAAINLEFTQKAGLAAKTLLVSAGSLANAAVMLTQAAVSLKITSSTSKAGSSMGYLGAGLGRGSRAARGGGRLLRGGGIAVGLGSLLLAEGANLGASYLNEGTDKALESTDKLTRDQALNRKGASGAIGATGSIIGGAISGAQVGSMGGPWGTVIGGIAGAGLGAMSSYQSGHFSDIARWAQGDTAKDANTEMTAQEKAGAFEDYIRDDMRTREVEEAKANAERYFLPQARARMAGLGMGAAVSAGATGDILGGTGAQIAGSEDTLRELKESLVEARKVLNDVLKDASMPEEAKNAARARLVQLDAEEKELTNQIVEIFTNGLEAAAKAVENRPELRRIAQAMSLGQATIARREVFGMSAGQARTAYGAQAARAQAAAEHSAATEAGDISSFRALGEEAKKGKDANQQRAIDLKTEEAVLARTIQTEEKRQQALEASIKVLTVAAEKEYARLSVMQESLTTELDLATYMGASFERIYDIQRDIVESKRMELEITRKSMESMEAAARANGESLKDNTQYQELQKRAMRESADIIKSQIGLQRDFLDRAMEKAFGMPAGTRINPIAGDRFALGEHTIMGGVKRSGGGKTHREQAAGHGPGRGRGGIQRADLFGGGPGSTAAALAAESGGMGGAGAVAMAGGTEISGNIGIEIKFDNEMFSAAVDKRIQAKVADRTIAAGRAGVA